MKKIISLFQRNYDGDRLVRDEVVPGAEWVIAGEGVGTRKFDGTCCMVRDGVLFKRYDAKHGKQPPAGFEPAQDPDPNTGHWPGWLPVGDGPQDRWHREAFENLKNQPTLDTLPPVYPASDGTYELCGPMIQGNPESFATHQLIRHGIEPVEVVTRTYDGIKSFLEARNIEGIVWHHPDGRMVKIKRKDFFKK